MHARSQPHTPTPPPRRRRRWPQILTVVVLLIAAAIAALPFAVAYGLQRWLLAQGADAVEIADVDFNPFTGRLLLADLLVRDRDHVALQAAQVDLELAWLALWRRHLEVQRLGLEQARLRIEGLEQGWRIGGLALAPLQGDTGREDGRWAVDINQLDVQDITLQLDHPRLHTEAAIEAASLRRMPAADGTPGAARLRLQGTLAEARMNVEGMVAPFADAPYATVELALTDLPLQEWRPLLAGGLQDLRGVLTANLELTVSDDGQGLRIAPRGEWRIRDLAFGDTEHTYSAASVQWQGEGEVIDGENGLRVHDRGRYHLRDVTARLTAPAQGGGTGLVQLTAAALGWDGELVLEERLLGPPALQAEGTLGAEALRAAIDAADVVVSGVGVRWQGSARHAMQDVPTGYEVSGALAVRQPRAETRDGAPLAAAEALQLTGIDAKGTYVLAAEALTVEGWQTLGEVQGDAVPVLRGRAARLAPVALDDLRYFRAGEVTLEEVEGLLRRDREGGWSGLEVPAIFGTGAAVRTTPAAGGMLIDHLEVGAGSRLRIEDQGVSPPYEATLEIARLTVEALNSRQPNTPSALSLEGRLEEAPVRIEGSLRPFSVPPDAALQIHIESLALAPLSPYTAAGFGYGMARGRVDGTLDLKLIDRHLRGSAALHFRDLAVAPAAPERAQALDRALGMPLETALANLRDRRGDVQLALPIRGELDDPAFRVERLLQDTLAGTLREAIVTGLKLSLEPFGAVVLTADAPGEAEGAVRLEPLDFIVGSAHLSPVAEHYISRLAALLEERPQVRIRLCGISTAADRRHGPSDEQALIRLAEQRATAVKDALAGHHGVPARRIALCEGRIGEGVPRVEITL